MATDAALANYENEPYLDSFFVKHFREFPSQDWMEIAREHARIYEVCTGNSIEAHSLVDELFLSCAGHAMSTILDVVAKAWGLDCDGEFLLGFLEAGGWTAREKSNGGPEILQALQDQIRKSRAERDSIEN